MTFYLASVARITTLIATLVALIIAAGMPGVYFAMAYKYKLGRMEAEATLISETIQGGK